MADILKLFPKDGDAPGGETVAAWLRRVADEIENGTENPAHKAALIFYEDVGTQFAVRSRFCNTTTFERAALLAMAAHDSLNFNG